MWGLPWGSSGEDSALAQQGHGFNFDGQGTGIRHEREIKDDSKVFNLRNGVTTYWGRESSLCKALIMDMIMKQFVVAQLLSHVQLFEIPWTAACQASLTFIISLLRLKSIESVMPSDHLIFRCLLLLLPSIFPSISVFSNDLARCMRWPKYWSFSFSIGPSSE